MCGRQTASKLKVQGSNCAVNPLNRITKILKTGLPRPPKGLYSVSNRICGSLCYRFILNL